MDNVTVLPPKKICKLCGAEVEGNAYFCGNCGWYLYDNLYDKNYEDLGFDYETTSEQNSQPIQKPMHKKNTKKSSKKSQQQVQTQQIQQQVQIPQQSFQNNNVSVNEIVCPHCGSKNFQSCQMIYNSGTRTRSFSSSTGYRSYGTNSSILAQNASPPFQKETYWKYSIIFLALGFFSEIFSGVLPFIISLISFFFIASLFSSRSRKGVEAALFISIVIFGFFTKNNILSPNLVATVGFIIGAVFSIKTLYASYWNNTNYHKLYNEWLNTFVCKRCGTFFTINR